MKGWTLLFCLMLSLWCRSADAVEGEDIRQTNRQKIRSQVGHHQPKPPTPKVDFCPLASISTLLCSFTNEFICTSPFLSQHINPDHWSHPHGKTVPLQPWRASSDWPFHLGPASPPRQNCSPSAFQHRVSACSTYCPSVTYSTLARHDTLLTSHGGPTAHLVQPALLGARHSLNYMPSLHSHREIKLWKCMADQPPPQADASPTSCWD